MAEEDCEMLVDETISLVGSTDHLALQDDELDLDATISRTRGGLTPDDCDKGLPLGDRTQNFHSTFDISHHHSRPQMNSTPNGEEAPHTTFNVSKVGDQVGGENSLQLTYVMAEGGGSKVSTENLVSEKKPSCDGRNFTKPANVTNLLMLSPKDPDKTLVEATEEPPELSGKSATPKPRFSFGLDLTDCTLDCSIELCDISLASSGKATKSPINSLHKQNSFEMDESLGILTPDQMKEFLDSNNLELPLAQNSLNSLTGDHKISMHQCRVDQTPSPEELPLDPVAVKTDTALVMSNPQQIGGQYQEVSQTDSDPKTDQMTKSVASKVSVSFITSVTSITSLDTGYQGDGEMSRPASRGADHSPSNGPRAKAPPVQAFNAPVPRRQDPMTDSDFFTESDADDIFHHQRGGDRRAQVIDGQLYGPSMQAANVYIHQPQQGDDSCMESSGIFTDVDNRAEDDFTHRCVENDMSPDGSTDTLQSNGTECSQKKSSTSQSPASLPSLPSQQLVNPSPGATAGGKTVEEKAADDAAIAEVRGAQKSANSGDMDGDKSTIATQRSVKKVSPNRKHVKSEMGSAGKVREVRRSNTVGGLRSGHDSDMENQENKVPLKKIKPPNKWDGVMNKIAEGKTTGKTKLNISDVKSKVFCGLSRGSSKISATGSSTEQNSPKRLTITAKRGRTYSKDSQQSSQSDLSVSGGGCSPKLQPKSSILSRTAKKRDVRTITASPSDLGPPNKTTGNNANVRTTRVNNNAPQKRSPTITVQQSLPATVPDANKGSPPAKRMVQRRQQISSQPPTQAKLPLKDHNRLAGVVPLATKTVPGSINQQKVASGVRQQQQQQQSPGVVTKNGSIVAPIAENGFTGSHQTSLVKVPKSNGVLPERLTQCRDLAHANRGFEALGVVIQYLVHSLDAFSMPTLKQNHERTTRKLLETRLTLDETRTMCQELEVRLMEQEGREVRLKDDHLSEKEQMESRLMEVETRFRSFVAESNELRATHESELKEAKLRETNLMQRVSDLSTTENALRDKVVASEAEFGEKLRLAAMRERELQEKTIQLQRQLDETKAKGETRERELEEKVNLLQDELSVLRHTRANGPTPTSPTTRQRTTSSSGNHNQVLQDEVESLRCVLELKQSEISELRKHNQELQRAADELSATMIKLSAAESRVEDLEVQIGAKINEEKELLAKNKTLQESYMREQSHCSRLVLHNEELQWKLKHNSEKFSRTITELSKSNHEGSCLFNTSTLAATPLSSTRRHSDRPRTNGGDARLMECFEMDDVSPPTSPVMKGIVEKSDSVSWVLEMEDESAEALVSRVVRRAGSFRAQSTEKGTLKRTKCQAGAALSQSASAASILHQQPQDAPRNRSQSMSLRASGRNLARSNSVQTPCSSRVEWREPNFTSSPLPGKSPPKEGVRGNKKRGNLITCDTSALTPRSERTRLQLPTHSSVHDLQNLQPKESAGEAMVSGSNSEDEASSVDSSSTASSSCGEESSSNSASPTNRRLRLGDFVMQKNVGSLKDNNGTTPMEVTWSEDGDQYPSESIV